MAGKGALMEGLGRKKGRGFLGAAVWLVLAVMFACVQVSEGAEGSEKLEFITKFGENEITIMDVVSTMQRGGIRTNIEVPTTPYKKLIIDEMAITLDEILLLAKEMFGFHHRKDGDVYTFFDPSDLDGEETSHLDRPLGPISLVNKAPYEALTSLGAPLKIGVVSPRFSRNPDGKRVTLKGESYTLRQALDEIASQAGFMGWIFTTSNSLGGDKPVVVVYFGLFSPQHSAPHEMPGFEDDAQYLLPQ